MSNVSRLSQHIASKFGFTLVLLSSNGASLAAPAIQPVPDGISTTSPALIAQASPESAFQELQQENQGLRDRLQRLENLLNVSPIKTGEAQLPAPLVPKNGLYIQGDLGGQDRQLAGENGYTVTSFDGGFYGSAGVGYRLNKNFRISAEYANLTSNVDEVAACATLTCGATPSVDGIFFPGQGDIVLNQYTLNAYYDADGFGYRKRFRPYVGIGVGTQSSTINNLSNSVTAPLGLFANGNAWAPLITFSGGLSYVISQKAEIFFGGKYALGSELLFEDTAFGDLLPQSSRNWIINGGFRYTF